MLRKSACPFEQVKTKTYLPESPFHKNSLAGGSGLALMSVPNLGGIVPTIPYRMKVTATFENPTFVRQLIYSFNYN